MAVLGVALALVLELVLRLTLDYHIDYYAGTTREGRTETPYGEIWINSNGQPDPEWDLSDPRPRLAFYGDSVTYGVGAGVGHRISDRVREADPSRQVLTIAAVGARLKDPERVAALARELEIASFVYVMNLNDLTPDPPRQRRAPEEAPTVATSLPASPAEPDAPTAPPPVATGEAAARPTEAPATAEPATGGDDPWLRRVRAFVLDNEGSLRSRSYLYNFLRLRAKNLLTRMGYEASGFRAVELEPSKHPAVFDATAARVNRAAELLREQAVRFCVLLLPYEMQISAPAERRYRELGIPFDADFVAGATQREILRRLEPGIEVLDARAAFLDTDAPDEGRERNPVGEYFVHDRGDKIDWNHPTRAGHRRIADAALAAGFCGIRPDAPGGS